jgi:hypothetical protein
VFVKVRCPSQLKLGPPKVVKLPNVFFIFSSFGRRHQQQRKTGPNNPSHTLKTEKRKEQKRKKTQIEFLVSFSPKLTKKKKKKTKKKRKKK